MRAVLFTALSLTFAAGLACTHRAYQHAAEADTVEAYRAFLREAPKGDYAESARARIETLQFEEAAQLHTVLAYKRFLDAYPDSHHASAATARLATLRFNAAKERNTALAWRQFLAEHSASSHREEAERFLEAAELVEARDAGEVTSIVTAMQRTRDDGTRMVLETKLDDARFKVAMEQGARGLFAYLREVPAGVHREEARVELLRAEVKGLLVSGLLADALVKLDGHPLGGKLPGLREEILQAQSFAKALRTSADLTLKNAEPAWHLREIADLVKSLSAADPLDRWEAAVELGHHVSVAALDPLVEALRHQRNTKVRQAAFESLGRILSALPPDVREYELASRLEALRGVAVSPEVTLLVAVLLDLSGHTVESAAEYERAFVPGAPDPIILRRWADVRLARNERHSAAVAARQLSLWVRNQLSLDETEAGSWTVAQARAVCAAAEAARFSVAIVQRARKGESEFPEDLVTFEAEAVAAKRLAEARLIDVELALEQRQPDVRTCADAQVARRLETAERVRREALEALATRSDPLSRRLLERARDLDPSVALRQRAGALLSTVPVAGDSK